MKKTALFIGLIGSAVLLAGCTKTTPANVTADSQVAQAESEVTSVVTEAIEEQVSEIKEEVSENAGTITPAIDAAVTL